MTKSGEMPEGTSHCNPGYPVRFVPEQLATVPAAQGVS